MSKTTTCNWASSRVTKLVLDNLVTQGKLSAQDVVSWRAPEAENPPQPGQGEIVVFVDHIQRGFSPPGSKFLRDFLNFFDLHLQDIGPNSMTNLCQLQVFCKVYL